MVITAVIFWALALVVIYLRSPLRTWLNMKYLEHQVKSNIDPVELQRWATNLLAQYPNSGLGVGQNYYYDFNGTNLPTGLRNVKGYNHAVIVWESNVWVFCGGKDVPFLAVGSSAFTPKYGLRCDRWKPGVYFVGQQGGWR